jgi:hypothetical protein
MGRLTSHHLLLVPVPVPLCVCVVVVVAIVMVIVVYVYGALQTQPADARTHTRILDVQCITTTHAHMRAGAWE